MCFLLFENFYFPLISNSLILQKFSEIVWGVIDFSQCTALKAHTRTQYMYNHGLHACNPGIVFNAGNNIYFNKLHGIVESGTL